MDIKQVALDWIEKNLNKDDWTEDDWVSLGEDYDLNIYIDDDEKKRATAFPVINGETNIETWIEVL